ncbi:MAG: VUT family protein [Treponemataceae bacterium]|nr:VUT family protein [Treponemataceae bacterium]
MSKFIRFFKKEFLELKILLRNIPSLTVSFFILSVVCANLMANKELFNAKYVALDCGFAFSWIMFLCMDIICKRWGAKASVKVSLVALSVNLLICFSFALLSKMPGMWGAFYATGSVTVNAALNDTFGGSWYVVLGSASAFIVSSIVNALLNAKIGRKLKSDGFFAFAVRSYVSTIVAQFADNFIFATVVSKVFFGWSWTQVLVCSAVSAVFELLCEILFSGLGYRIVKKWEAENVGAEYLEFIKNIH